MVFATSPTFFGTPTFPAGSTGNASLRVPHGVAPTTPTDGDLWTTTAGVFARVNGVTQNLSAPAITVSTTAPGSPAVGDLWVDTN